MSDVDYLKNDQDEIFRRLVEFEEIIDGRVQDVDYWHLLFVFHKLTDLVFQHEQNKKFIMDSSNEYYLRTPLSRLFMDQRRVRGHIRVINQAILSKDINFIRVALDTDGRMVISNIKNHISREELILDRVLFLRMGS